jgi:hypothetical protein
VTIRAHDQPAITIEVVCELYAANGSEADEELERIKRGIISEGNRVDIATPELTRPEFMFFGRGPKVDTTFVCPRTPKSRPPNAMALSRPPALGGRRR